MQLRDVCLTERILDAVADREEGGFVSTVAAPLPMQEALHGVELQQLGERATRPLRNVVEPRVNRSGEAGRSRPRHWRVSR